MRIHGTSLPGVLRIEPLVHGDERGLLMETYHRQRFEQFGLPVEYAQENSSRSVMNTLRGLHYQYPFSQGKLVRVTAGRVFDVAVDIRRESPAFGQWFGCELSDENKLQLWIPAGFAHGFCVLSDSADFSYKCTEYYHPEAEQTILWNDPDIGIQWPAQRNWLLSPKDAAGRFLKDLTNLPYYNTVSNSANNGRGNECTP